MTSARVLACGAAAACAIGLFAAAQPRAQAPPGAAFAAADLQTLRQVAEVDVAPDGSRIAYTVATPGRSGAPASVLWLYDVAKGTHTQVGDGRTAATYPRWSPDSRWIAFLGRGDGRPGLMLVRVDDEISDPELLAPVTTVNHPLPYTGAPFAWSPGSSRLAYVSGMAGADADDSSGDPAVVTRPAYKPAVGEGPGRFADNRRLQVFMVDLVSRQPQQLTDDAFHHHSLQWAAKGDDLYFVADPAAGGGPAGPGDLHAVNIVKRATRRITETPELEADPVPSPDAATVALRAPAPGPPGSRTAAEDLRVWVMRPDGKARRDPGGPDNRHGTPRWSADGQWLYFPVDERGDVRIYRLKASGGGGAEPLVPPSGQPGRVTAWSLARTGLLAYAFAGPEAPPELFVLPPGGTPARVTTLNAAPLEGRTTAAVTRFSFAGEGGVSVEAFLTKPPSASATSKAPLVVVIHGGPFAQQGPQFDLRPQVYAARGWATLAVNYRGSSGYGRAFAGALADDWNGADARDILAGIDAAVAGHDWIDGTRLVVEGDGYGGLLANWLVTRSDRFKAAVSVAGISNLLSYTHTTAAAAFTRGDPRSDDWWDRLVQRSPLRHAARVKTPVLLLHGEMDNTVPIGESEQFFAALVDAGGAAQFVRYPREGHGLRELRHQVDALERAVAWYATYLK